MNADPDPVHDDDEFTARLLACEEALAAGAGSASLAEDTSPELRTRLLRGLDCVQRLQQLRPQRPALDAVEPEEACPPRIGRFEIRCPLGRGGFGIVYRAYDPVLGRDVALKIPRADALVDAECQARFQREARAAAGLDHPNLVPVHEAGQLGPISYIAFAYCPGSDLAAWLKERKTPVRCIEAARLVRTLARAIHFAHGCGILHRDLKPSNILLSPIAHAAAESPDNHWRPDADTLLIPRVTDFGLAKFAAGDQGQTQSGDLLGTPSYMPPEQVESRLGPVGPATDVYALGAILYEVITGRPPFWAESTVATLLQVKTIEPVKPGRLRPELPRDLETICLKCLQKEPRKRYASAEALAEDLDRFLSGRPILARPVSRPEQALKLARRHPALALSLAALLLVTFGGTGGIFEQWQETQGALADAVTQKVKAQQAQQAEVREKERALQAQQNEAKEHERSEVALYHHRVVLAHHEWLAGNVGRAAQLLDECRPDLRNWEWRYVRQLCDSAVFTCAGHSTNVSSVAFSPDGRYVASTAGQWKSKEAGEVILWDAATGALIWTGAGHTNPVMSIAFSPDGGRLATATANWGGKTGEVKTWETATGKSLKTLAGMPGGAFSVAYSPDGSRLATAGWDAKVRVWDPDSGEQLFVLEGHRSNIFSVAFSPDGQQLASAGWEGVAIIWDLASRREVKRLPGPQDLRSVAFSPDGRQLVAASFDHSVKIWDTATWQLRRTYWGHRAPTLCATFAPDGRRIASTDTAGVVHVWDAETGKIFRTVRGHTGVVAGAAFSPNGRQLASAGQEKTVRVWDITHEQDAHSFPLAAGAQNVAFSPNGRLLAASGYSHSSGIAEKRVRVWPMDDPAGPRYWDGHNGLVRCVAFSPDDKLLASGSTDKSVRLWNVAKERTLHELKGHTDTVMGVAFNHDGTRLASASFDKTVRLWDVAAAQLLATVLPHPYPVHDVAFSPDGKRLVAVGANGMAVVWDATNGTQLFVLPGHGDIVACVAFSPKGPWLATAGSDKQIRIWDMTAESADGQAPKLRHVLAGHTDRIVGLCFSPDGLRLASTGGDQTIRLWDVVSGDDALTLRGHPDFICGVAFSPDGRLLVSASTRDIKIWDAGNDKATPPNPARLAREARAWHEQEALACRWAEPPQWFGVAFHTSRLIDAQPKDWRLWGNRANANLELGRWQQAHDDASRSIAQGAAGPWVWCHQAVASLQLGDTDAYRRCCADMLKRYRPDRLAPSGSIGLALDTLLGNRPASDRERASQAHFTAWCCVMSPAAAADAERIVRLAEIAVQVEPANARYRHTLGAALYRAGRFQAALTALQQAQRAGQKNNQISPDDWLFLALVHHRLGHAAEAQRWFDKATKWTADRRDQGKSSTAWLTCRVDILHAEAAALLTKSMPNAKD